MQVKICGIKDQKTAIFAAENGVDALGFVFAPSSRRITAELAKDMIQYLPKTILKIGVFVNEEISEVKEIVEYCGLNAIQLHGLENLEYCQQFKSSVTLIKAIRVTEKGVFIPEPAKYRGVIQFFLTDTYQQNQEGGTGKIFPWEKALPVKEYGSVILAGGLNSENIEKAMNALQPWGVDVSSGVETNSLKDTNKIKMILQKVRRWENEHNITR